MNEVRIDKWLWATRIFKTRSVATEACKKGRISIDGITVKPSRIIHVGEKVSIRKPPVTYTFKVLDVTGNRINAKLTPLFLENITPKEEYEILELNRISGFVDRAKGLGRPTKKDRRDMVEFVNFEFDNTDTFDWDD